MNIKILDSWLRDYLKTKATPQEIAKSMSLTSVSIERMEKFKDDTVYEIEVTTNRPDLLSVVGLAREASAVLPQFGYDAEFISPKLENPSNSASHVPLKIVNDDKLVGRICAAVLEVDVKESPLYMKDRLETSDIRSLNNVIDVTNYIMRAIGHPAHVFDYDRLPDHTINIRESEGGESITTLDGKKYILPGGDIIAKDGSGNIIDLLGIMGLENSVVTENTKRIVLFINNNDKHKMRSTSMKLNIRTEAVQMNEKGIDPELAYDALLYGIQLYEEIADAKLLSPLIDIYPAKQQSKTVSVTHSHIEQVIGIPITLEESASILRKLGFVVTVSDQTISAVVPSYRFDDIDIPEDLIEEIARIYGYHNLPSVLPPITSTALPSRDTNPFYWEERAKNALKYWGFTEVYTYPMVSEEMYEGPIGTAVKLANPLGEEFVFMRRTLIPNLLKVMNENKSYESMRIFEIANIYEKQGSDLPNEIRKLALLVKEKNINFFKIKGIIEQLINDLGITGIEFTSQDKSGLETNIVIDKEEIGTIEILDDDLINAEINFEALMKSASIKRTYTPLPKYPSIFEDLTVILPKSVTTGDVIKVVHGSDDLIKSVILIDSYQDSRTYHIEYQDSEKNLSTTEVKSIHEKILTNLQEKLQVKEK